MFVQGSHAFAMFLAHALRECALFRNTAVTYTYIRTYTRVSIIRDVSSLLLHLYQLFFCLVCVVLFKKKQKNKKPSWE